jgi:nitrogen-specific signal transduction histidine kinase
VEVTGTATRDADGQVAGAVWVLRDITDEELVEHERAKSARLESLGVLAGGLAHDFNNILMGVTGNLSLAQGMVSPDNKALLARLTNASAACARARGVTNQLLTFAKGGAPVKKTASIRELVTECTRFALSGSPVKPAFDVHPELWAADVDTGQVGQVVQNLVLNAMQAMSKGGVLEVALHNIDLEIPADAPLVPGKYVRLSVRDTGTGIPADVLNRIFDPYFSTKEKGSGLGLAISYSIVRAHGGAITVESEIGVGSTFTVYLPASSAMATIAPAPRPEINMRRSGRVLIMDDEDMVAEVAQEMIESLGYTTQRACNGDEAIQMFNEAERTGEPFDLVLLDLTVPGGMGGAEAVKYIREMRDDVCVLVNSGYADDCAPRRRREETVM